ncbi:hypothetical protein PBY51_016503 [Eleginops maclovinus]|uniref:Uncharacterized protein n=1 Tax=Eleginops maclovinus TaxID=56733 RepID=A0AAN7XR39_ELEMC|nr:hypothetical protein PBY51_016503 [Eleginops maclovinus]
MLLNLKLAAEIVPVSFTTLLMLWSGPFLCPACDPIVHGKHVFHDREAMIDGFFRPIPPTSLVVVDESGQYGLCEQGGSK